MRQNKQSPVLPVFTICTVHLILSCTPQSRNLMQSVLSNMQYNRTAGITRKTHYIKQYILRDDNGCIANLSYVMPKNVC